MLFWFFAVCGCVRVWLLSSCCFGIVRLILVSVVGFAKEAQGQFCKRVALANVPSFRFFVASVRCLYPRSVFLYHRSIFLYPLSGFLCRRSVFCILVPVFCAIVPIFVPSFRFRYRRSFFNPRSGVWVPGKPPFCEPLNCWSRGCGGRLWW